MSSTRQTNITFIKKLSLMMLIMGSSATLFSMNSQQRYDENRQFEINLADFRRNWARISNGISFSRYMCIEDALEKGNFELAKNRFSQFKQNLEEASDLFVDIIKKIGGKLRPRRFDSVKETLEEARNYIAKLEVRFSQLLGQQGAQPQPSQVTFTPQSSKHYDPNIGSLYTGEQRSISSQSVQPTTQTQIIHNTSLMIYDVNFGPYAKTSAIVCPSRSRAKTMIDAGAMLSDREGYTIKRTPDHAYGPWLCDAGRKSSSYGSIIQVVDPEGEKDLVRAIHQALDMAEEEGFTHLAIPTIGYFRKDQIHQFAQEWLNNYKGKRSLQEIWIVSGA